MNIKLSEIVAMFLDGSDYGEAEYAKAYRIAMRGWRQLNWDVTGEFKEFCVDVECDLTACIPDGIIKVLGVGIVSKKGTFSPLTENPGLTGFSGSEVQTEDWFKYKSNWQALSSAGRYGIGSHKNIGEYRIDLNSNKIIFDINLPYKEIIIRANTHPKIDGEFVINEMASEALLALFDRYRFELIKLLCD